MSKVFNVICDICKKEIAKTENFIEYEENDLQFHIKCFDATSPKDMVKVLQLDRFIYRVSYSGERKYF